jgi:hypothetical protein
MSFFNQRIPLTAFGEVSTATPFPVVQVTGLHGLNGKLDETTVSTGSVAVVGSEFVCSSGTGAGGIAAISSTKIVAYRAGQGMKSLFTARFTQGVADNFQLAGINNATDGFSVGYNAEIFGIFRRHDGALEIQELTMTTGASGGESATVTIDGTGFTVPLTAGTVQHNAAEIAVSLNTQVANWQFQQVDDQVIAVSQIANTISGAFTFASATAVGTFAQINVGARATTEFVAQADWNIDTRISSDPNENLVPTNGNVYSITVQYLGYGAIDVEIEDKDTGEPVIVHRFKYANSETTPSLGNPSLNVGASVSNIGNTSDINVAVASLSAFNEGEIVMTEESRSQDVFVASVGTTETPLLSIENRIASTIDRDNNAEIKIESITGSTDAAKTMIFRIYIDGVLTAPNFQYVDKTGSISLVDKVATAITGTATLPFVATSGTPGGITPKDLFLSNGQRLTVTGEASSGAGGEVVLTVDYKDDI